MAKKQPFYSGAFRASLKLAVYFLFRPKVIWKDKSLKKLAKKQLKSDKNIEDEWLINEYGEYSYDN